MSRSDEEQQERDIELEQLKNAEVGTVERMGCANCEGLEEHKKLEDGTWKCLWCGAEIIKL